MYRMDSFILKNSITLLLVEMNAIIRALYLPLQGTNRCSNFPKLIKAVLKMMCFQA